MGAKTKYEDSSSISNSGSSEKIKLERQIGLFEAVAITVGAIVGSGWI